METASDPFYSLDTIDHIGEVTATYEGETIARTSRAKIMFETRLPATIYFPKQDVMADLTKVEGLNTFCPFKGTATYWDVAIGGHVLPSAGWSYDTPLEESREIEGHVAFAPQSGLSTNVLEGAIPPRQDGHISGPIMDWIMRQSSFCTTPEDLTRNLAERFVEEGIALSRMSIMIWSLHPQIIGQNFIWHKGSEEIKVFNPSYELLDMPAYVNSPLKHVSAGLGGVRQPLNRGKLEFDFPILKDLIEEGATDYVAMPLRFSNGKTNVLTLTCDHPDGFSTSNLGLIFECSTIISRLFEVFTLQRTASTLLETYLGERTGARVMGGEIRRGDGEALDAAVMICDLRNSSAMTDILSREDYLKVLNSFFEMSTNIINAHGGEVLKFIGDAVLAVFPTNPDQIAACSSALDASDAILNEIRNVETPSTIEPLACAIGVDFGNVTYGNIGSQKRLDFTVIGTATNIAARLGELGKKVGKPLIISERVASVATGTVQSLGEFELHNVAEPVTAYTTV